jgi:hypothetical protein
VPYVALLIATIALGLATRRFPSAFPGVVAEYGGDALWAAMMFWLGALIGPGTRTYIVAAGAVAFAYAVEISQLYHAPWIDAIRATRPGALVLGQGFLWSDLVSYAVGVFAAAVLDAVLVRQHSMRAAP